VPPRLIATDLDGTLLRRDGSVSLRTQRALAAAVAAGIDVVVVTARPPRYLAPLAPLLPPSTLGICANGAMTCDLHRGSVLSVRPLSLAVARRITTLVAMPGLGFAIETGASVVFEPGFAKPDNGDVRLSVECLDEMWLHGRPIVKLLAWSASATADDLAARASAAVGSLAECTHSGGVSLLEVSAAGVTKASALAALCAARGIAPSSVLAFGDMPNDLPMLRWAGRPYAVANAHPSVLASVSSHTASNDADGVAQVVERLL
jgi:hypothetical protein